MRKSTLFPAVALSLALPTLALSQSVTVHSDGTSGDYQTLPAAITALQNNPDGPDIITILDVGPHEVFGGVAGDANLNDFTIQGSDDLLPERPIVVTSGSDGIGFWLNMPGTTTLRNLIFIPSMLGPRSQDGIRYGFAASPETSINITIDNVLVTSNDGNDQPFTHDGITLNAPIPADLEEMHGYRFNGIRINPSNPDVVHSVSITNTVTSALPGYVGIRLRMSGAEGSEFLLGEGIRVSHLQGTNVAQGGLLIYENAGDEVIRVEGTEENPIRIHDNAHAHGIQTIYGIGGAGSVERNFSNVIITNNGGAGYYERDVANPADDHKLTNVTIANNEGPAILMAPDWAGTLNASNVIAAGNGSADEDNVIRVETSSTGEATFTNSAVVLDGPYALAGDGFDPENPGNVTLTDVLNSNPAFATLNPASEDYATVTAEAYGEAGPDGEDLRGGGKYNFVLVTEATNWNLYN